MTREQRDQSRQKVRDLTKRAIEDLENDDTLSEKEARLIMQATQAQILDQTYQRVCDILDFLEDNS